jgi:hypothetical protein
MMTGYNGEYVPKTAGNLLFVCEMEAPQLLYFWQTGIIFHGEKPCTVAGRGVFTNVSKLAIHSRGP